MKRGDYMIYDQKYENARDEAYLEGLKTNSAKVEDMSLNEKELKRHECKMEMNSTKVTITALWEKVFKRKILAEIVQTIFKLFLILLFVFLYHYANSKTEGDMFILTMIIIGGILIIVFANTKVFTETIQLAVGLTDIESKLTDYYKKYGDLESLLKLADYRKLNDGPRTNILHPEIKK